MIRIRLAPLPLFAFLAAGAALRADDAALQSALTFHASFDHGLDADFAKGDARLHTLTDRQKGTAEAGLHANGMTKPAEEAGRFGHALAFTSRDAPWVFYQAEGNLAYRERDWGGSVSLWLKCDPVNGLAEGYCDPVQITPRAWNDAAFFLDFDKEGTPRDFRLGAFADLNVWNPDGGEVPEAQRPLLTAKDPKFGPDRWTHIVFTWTGFNTESKEAAAKLYLDGELNGTLTGWNQQFTWKDDETPRLLIGLHYVGLLDDLACFNRALTAEEVQRLHTLDGGVAALRE